MARHMGWNNWNAANNYFGQGPGGRRDALLAQNPPVTTQPIGGGNGGNGGGGGGRHRNQGNSLAHEQNPFSIVQPPVPDYLPNKGSPAPTAPAGSFVNFANSLGQSGAGTGQPEPGVASGPGVVGGGPGVGFGGGPPGVYSAAAANTAPTDTSGWLFDPNSQYGGTTYQPGDWLDTDIGNKQFQDNPAAAWQYWIAKNGIDPMSQRGQTARSLLSRVSDAYDAATLDNPMLQRRDFLKGIDPNALLANMSPGERGETPGRYQGRARTISRGYGGG